MNEARHSLAVVTKEYPDRTIADVRCGLPWRATYLDASPRKSSAPGCLPDCRTERHARAQVCFYRVTGPQDADRHL